ncbi:MAG: hypothetical protein ACRC7O_00570 [Fimbriiglobus sp.]
MNRQPGIPKGERPKQSPPYEEANYIVIDCGPAFTADGRPIPVQRLRGARPLAEILAEEARLGIRPTFVSPAPGEPIVAAPDAGTPSPSE